MPRTNGGIIGPVNTPSDILALGVWSLEEVRQSIANGRWPKVSDSFFNYTTLLLTGDGTNGAQNNTFVDSSTNNFSITRNGNTTQGTFSPYGDRWSNYFDGTGDYLSIADTANLRPGSGTFTIEAWINRDAAGTAHTIYAKGGTSTGVAFLVTSGNVLRFTHTTTNIDSTGTIAASTWTHVAVVREGTGSNETKLYINGVQVGAGTVSTDFTQTEQARVGTNRSAGENFKGYISNVRFVKGTALYTENFKPSTTPLTEISDTQLLTCQSNRFRDASSNNFAITRNGDVSVQRFSPFAPSAAYDPSVIGGSGYFDGTGDFFHIASSSALSPQTGDFCIEAWIYVSSWSSSFQVIYSGNSTGIFFGNLGNNLFGLRLRGSGDLLARALPPVNTWTHVAVTRNGSSLRMFYNGVQQGVTVTNSTNFSVGETGIGAVPADGSLAFGGYISNLRFIKGTALYTAAFTPPTAPLTAVTNTSLLLNFTNAGIIDSTGSNVFETLGDAQISTSVKKFGTGSLYFDGTGDSLLSPSSINNSLGNGSFTVEFWVNPTNTSSGFRSLVADDRYGASLAGGWDVYQNGSSIQVWQTVTTSSSSLISRSSVLVAGQWTHIAWVRNGSTNYLFIDGVFTGSTVTSSTNYIGTRIYVGIQPSGFPFVGYIDDLRITKGIARYTTNFTPNEARMR
jgi:hypothetical protein